MDSNLQEKLKYKRAYRDTRKGIALWVIEYPENLEELITISFNHKDKESYKAAWVLEFVALEDIQLLYPYLDVFANEFPNSIMHQSIRSFAHILELLMLQAYKKKDTTLQNCITPQQKEKWIACCFDWLLTQQKVACEVRAMLSLYYLGKDEDWVYPELKLLLTENIHKKSAAYKARAKYVLNQLNKASF